MSEEEKSHGVSRRDFFKGAGFAAAGAAGVLAAGCAPKQSMSATGEEKPVAKAVGHVMCSGEEANPECNCGDCRSCEAVCSLLHEGVVNPNLSRIRVAHDPERPWRPMSFTCRHCDYPECYYACQQKGAGALHIDEETGARVINQDQCIGCQSCLHACPRYPDAPIHYNPSTNKCFKCDLCGGDPQCVRHCPQAALVFEKGDE